MATLQISELIQIKNYIMNIRQSASATIERYKFNELDYILSFIDNKIIDLILSEPFKEAIQYVPKEVVKAKAESNIIKSSMFKKVF